MGTVLVKASSFYNIKIERGILDRIGEECAEVIRPCRTVMVSGEKVYSIYGEAVKKSLERAGFEVIPFAHESGESAKSIETYGKLQNFICENRLDRDDVLIALGGGVTGDLTGFAAATFKRGIAYVQIPTSLLAMVDSSVGGKTAVNLTGGKNQVGCFYQPAAVFCDVDVLRTLPEDEYRCGCAEIVKYGVLKAEFFTELEQGGIRDNEEKIITECVSVKRNFVEADEYDRDCRRLLNLGHTVGHAAEKCSGYTLSHGDAVAMGLAVISRGAVKHGICASEDCGRIVALLEKYGLPTECVFSVEDIIHACMADKKISGGRLNLVVPEKVGSCRIIPVNTEELKSWLEK